MPFVLLDVVRAESKLELARRIHAKWRELAPRDRIPAAVAISNRLGDLERERPAWWESEERPTALRAFEQVTGVPFRTLPLAREFIPSPEFPQLRPFRPLEEAPLELAMTRWFAAPGEGERRWIVSPPGAGQSFAVQWHRLRGTARAVEVTRLADATNLVGVDAPLVIGVDAPDPETDDGAMARLTARAAVLVLAPFAPPKRASGNALHGEGKDRGAEDGEATDREAEDGEATDRGAEDGEAMDREAEDALWGVEEWQPAPGWRQQLVQWIATRIDDDETLLDADQLVEWLERLDPRGEIIATPGDVVALSAFVHESGLPSFRRNVAEHFLHGRMAREAVQVHEGGLWLRTWGGDTVKALAEARLQRLDLALWGPLDRSVWASLLPADLAPRGLDEAEVEALLDRRTSRKQAREQLLRRPAPEAIELLISARLLRAQGEGFALHPRWVALWFARARVRREIMDGAPATWGRWAVDAGRRALVDAELDELGFDVLVRISDRAVRALDRTGLGSVGAVESVFAAVGRRLGPRMYVPEVLHALGDAQRSLLIERYSNAPPLAPRTRPGLESRGEWVECCWRWSLYGPKMDIGDSAAWLFPGWCDRLAMTHMAELEHYHLGEPAWSGQEPPAEFDRPRRPGPTFGRLLEMAFELVPRCQDAVLPARLPAVLLPAILLTAHRRAPPWSLAAEHIRRLTGSRWGSEYLVERTVALPLDERVAVARTIWSAIVEQRGAIDAINQLRRSALQGFLADHLPVDDFACALSLQDASHLGRILELPLAFREALVRHALRHRPGHIGGLEIALERTASRVDAPWIELLADACQPSWPYCQALWRVAPERALERTLAAELDTTADRWFLTAPGHVHARLLDHLASSSRALPHWAVLWLRHRVVEGGVDADRAYALSQQQDQLR